MGFMTPPAVNCMGADEENDREGPSEGMPNVTNGVDSRAGAGVGTGGAGGGPGAGGKGGGANSSGGAASPKRPADKTEGGEERMTVGGATTTDGATGVNIEAVRKRAGDATDVSTNVSTDLSTVEGETDSGREEESKLEQRSGAEKGGADHRHQETMLVIAGSVDLSVHGKKVFSAKPGPSHGF